MNQLVEDAVRQPRSAAASGQSARRQGVDRAPLSGTPDPFGRRLLAGVGVALCLTGSSEIAMPVIGAGISVATGMAILMLGFVLVVLSAFYESAHGELRCGFWRISFGEPQPAELPAHLRDEL